MNDPRSQPLSNTMPSRRARGQTVVARALWYVGAGKSELRPEKVAPPSPGHVRIATHYSAISRGTERLVAFGDVPKSEWPTMRAPMQAGDFSFPVKYGYSATGEITAGPDALIGRRAFVLHPHQDHFQAPTDAIAILPDNVPSRRATLAANMETALNAHWDAGTTLGDNVLVVGAGIVGLLTAFLARKIAGANVAILDVDPARRRYAEALGIEFVTRDPPAGAGIVFHASATSDGLQTAIDACAFEGRIVEMSWYGSKPVHVALGGAFHSRRLTILSSQVGHVAPSQRARVRHRDRLARAIALLEDDRLDALVDQEIAFEALPARLADVLSAPGLPPVVRY
jgi:2-desacetyl-2-hydroxyethyl bacteriochlorophyllide A dehydrogenase